MSEFELTRPLTSNEIVAQKRLIQEVMNAVMKKDEHYGVIPGCEKPSLLKPGSETLLSTFKIAVEPTVEDLSNADEVRFRVFTKGIQWESGVTVGIGIGECSSNEDKYKWRKAICDKEWEETLENRRREKWCKGYKDRKTGQWVEPYKVKQVRTETADVANTVLKMAKKRSQIDLTLTATAASDIFTQDIEDLPEEIRDSVSENEQSTKPEIKPTMSKSQKTTEQKETDLIPPCTECDGPIAGTPEEAQKVIAWCKSKNYEKQPLCKTCQGKYKK
jgi:gas vesicle protein